MSRTPRTIDLFRDSDDLAGMPVVVADLHSALPAVIAGLRESRPDATVAYVATDGGALPLAFSRSVQQLREAGWLVGSVTVGQTFGGDLEAVTVHNGLLAARPGAGGRRGCRRPGTGQSRHRHPLGVLRSRGGRGGQRRRDAGRSTRSPLCGSPRPTPASATTASRTTP